MPNFFANAIQDLNVLVDPSEEALPTDDLSEDNPGPLVTDPSTNNNAEGRGERNPLYKGKRRQVRRGGSGHQPNRNQHEPLVAREDSASANVGDGPQDVNVLSNDDWTGVPKLTILSGPLLSGASAVVIGTGTGSKIEYTPPPTGSGGNDVIVYQLTSSRSRGKATAKLKIAVTATSDPHLGSYSGTVTGGLNGLDLSYDVRLFVTMATWNGVPNVPLTIGIDTEDDDPAPADGPPDAFGVVYAGHDELFYPSITTGPCTITLSAAGGANGYRGSITFP